MNRSKQKRRHSATPAMRCVSLALLVALLSIPTDSAAAQQSVAGRIFLSLGGGMTFGPGELWSLQRQPLVNPNLTPATGEALFIDTLLLDQGIESGSSFLVSFTGYPSKNIGLGMDLGYHGFRSSRNCRVVFDSGNDPRVDSRAASVASSPNLSTCEDVRARTRDATTLDVMPFVAWRVLPNREITPMLKAGAGIALVPCTVRVNSPIRELISGGCSSTAQPMWGASLGFYRQTDIEAQFHFEFRYTVHRWGIITGNADTDGNAPVGTRWSGGLGFSMGVDFQV